MSTRASINGVDTTKLAALRDKLEEESGQGDTLWKAKVIWQSSFPTRFVSVIFL